MTAPKRFTSAELAERLGVCTRSANRLIQASGVGQKIGGRWSILARDLVALRPEVLEDADLSGDDDRDCPECDRLRAALLAAQRREREILQRFGALA